MRSSHKRFRNGHTWTDAPFSQEREPELETELMRVHKSRVPSDAKIWGIQDWEPEPEAEIDYFEELEPSIKAKIEANTAKIIADGVARNIEMDKVERALCYWSPNKGGIGGEWIRDPLKMLGIDQTKPAQTATHWNDRTTQRVKWGKTKKLFP